jgi:hypothetical protein
VKYFPNADPTTTRLGRRLCLTNSEREILNSFSPYKPFTRSFVVVAIIFFALFVTNLFSNIVVDNSKQIEKLIPAFCMMSGLLSYAFYRMPDGSGNQLSYEEKISFLRHIWLKIVMLFFMNASFVLVTFWLVSDSNLMGVFERTDHRSLIAQHIIGHRSYWGEGLFHFPMFLFCMFVGYWSYIYTFKLLALIFHPSIRRNFLK